MIEVRDGIVDVFGRSHNFGISEISLDRKKLIIRWHGPVPQRMKQMAAVDTEGFSVTIEGTEYPHGELDREARRLVAESTGTITGAAASPSGDGILVDVDPKASGAAVDAELESISPSFPVTPSEESEPTAAVGWRWDDHAAHYGGSVVINATTRYNCSTSWRVREPSTGRTGMMTASHCGQHGDRYDIANDEAPLGDSFGTVVREYDNRDAAIMTGSSYAPRQYIGAYNGSQYATVVGYATSFSNGQEICYSGGFSGSSCGHVVVNPAHWYSLGSLAPYQTQGVETRRMDGVPWVGQGDSGGPGLLIYSSTSSPSGYVAYAGTVISAVYDSGGGCMGLNYPGRVCGHRALSTMAQEAATAMGWQLY
jgi:hypothetical protein